jgi:hypothetical protein
MIPGSGHETLQGGSLSWSVAAPAEALNSQGDHTVASSRLIVTRAEWVLSGPRMYTAESKSRGSAQPDQDGFGGSRITQIYEATNQIQRVVMARQLLK